MCKTVWGHSDLLPYPKSFTPSLLPTPTDENRIISLSCVSFFLDNSLKSFDVVSRLPPEQSQHVLLLRISKASTGMNLGLQFTPQIFIWIQVRALCRPASNVHFGLLEVAPVQERHMFCWLLSRTQHKSLTATTQFWCWLLGFYDQRDLVSCHLSRGRIPVSIIFLQVVLSVLHSGL